MTDLGLLGGSGLLDLLWRSLGYLDLGCSLDLLDASWLCGLGLCHLGLGGCLGGLWILGDLGALGLCVETSGERESVSVTDQKFGNNNAPGVQRC